MTPNSAAPPRGTRLCALDDLADPGARGFLFRQDEWLFMGFLVRRGEAAFGYIDRCPHAGMPMASFNDRYLTREGDLILCAAHGALFRLEDGICVAGPCAGRALTAWQVVVEQGVVVVD